MSNLVERLRSDAKKYREGTGAGVHEELDYQWSDKPHRHVYDLCRRLEEAADEIERLTAALAAAEVTAWNAAIEAADNALCALWKETP